MKADLAQFKLPDYNLKTLRLLYRKVTKVLLIVAILLLIILIITFNLQGKLSVAQQQLQQAERQTNINQHKLAKLTTDINEIKSAHEFWQKVNQGQDREGLRLDDAKTLIEEIQQNYIFFEPVQISLSAIDHNQDLHDIIPNYDGHTAIVSTRMLMNIKAFEDVSIVQFLDELMTKMPGFIQVEKLELSRKSEFSLQTIDSINNGESNWFINAAIELVWLDLKDISQSPSNTNLGGAHSLTNQLGRRR